MKMSNKCQINYTISMEDPNNHVFNIKIEVDGYVGSFRHDFLEDTTRSGRALGTIAQYRGGASRSGRMKRSWAGRKRSRAGKKRSRQRKKRRVQKRISRFIKKGFSKV